MLQGGLRWPEPGGTFWLVSANSSSAGERMKQEGERCSQVQTVERGLIAPRRATGGGSPTTVPGDRGARFPVGRLSKLLRLPWSRSKDPVI